MRVALIGSRKPPESIKPIAIAIGKLLYENGSRGFSGGAIGMDELFMREFGIESSFVIVPERKYSTPEHYYVWDELDNQTKIKCYIHAKKVCPDFDERPLYVQKLFARNVCQVLGLDCMEPVDKVIYWAKQHSGLVSGGTRIAVYVARNFGIPCENLLNEEVYGKYKHLYQKPSLDFLI